MNLQGLVERASTVSSVGAMMLGAVALGAVVLGTTLFAASLHSGPSTLPSPTVATAARRTVITWQSSVAAALLQSKVSGKAVMVDFGAKWCGACRLMDEQTYPDRSVVAESKNFEMVRVDVDEQPDLAAQYGISSLPTTVWLCPDGQAIVGVVGALEANDFVSAMRQAKARVYGGAGTQQKTKS